MSLPSSPSSKLSLLFFFFLSLSSSFATSDPSHDPAHQPQSHAEKLIRSHDDDDGFVPGMIVEKKFSFLGDSGPSVEDLGHHAGYYSLPHSKAAR